jgi:hypothetical protein
LTIFSGEKCLSGKVICAFFCPAYRSSPVFVNWGGSHLNAGGHGFRLSFILCLGDELWESESDSSSSASLITCGDAPTFSVLLTGVKPYKKGAIERGQLTPSCSESKRLGGL